MYLAVCKRISDSKRGEGGLFYFFNQNVEFTSHVPYFNLRTSQPVFRVCIYLKRVEIEKNICTTIYMLSLNFIIYKKKDRIFLNAISLFTLFFYNYPGHVWTQNRYWRLDIIQIPSQFLHKNALVNAGSYVKTIYFGTRAEMREAMVRIIM